MKNPFSRKQTAQPATKAEKPMAAGGLSVARMNLVAMVVTVLVIFLSGYVAYLQYASLIYSRQEDNRNADAATIAAVLSGRLRALSDEVERLAIPDQDLLEAILSADRQFLRQREALVHRNFPTAMRIRYILPDDDQPDDTVNPPLSYACLELARHAERGGDNPPFEVHLFGGEVEHLDLVRPVIRGDAVVASLMVTLDVETLKQWVDELNPDDGYIELQQEIDGDLLKLFGRGNAALKVGESGYRAKVDGSRWLLIYWPSDAMGVAEVRSAGFLATFAIAAGLLVAFFIFHGLFLSGFVRADMKRMINFVVDSSMGKRFHSYPVKLAEAKQVLQEKEADLAVLASYTSTQESIHDKAEQFIPDITFSGDAGISVEEVDESPPGQEKKDRD